MGYKELFESYNNDGIEFGVMPMRSGLFRRIVEVVPEGSTILEFGSGNVTGLLSNIYNMNSVEHNEDWCNRYKSNYYHAPLVESDDETKYDTWYDTSDGRLFEWIGEIEYNALIIDGPGGDENHNRQGVIQHLHKMKTGIWWFIDDTNRPDGRGIVDYIKDNFDVLHEDEPDGNHSSALFVCKKGEGDKFALIVPDMSFDEINEQETRL